MLDCEEPAHSLQGDEAMQELAERGLAEREAVLNGEEARSLVEGEGQEMAQVTTCKGS